MNQTTLEKIISDTQSSPYIKWNDETLADLIRYDNVYNVFIFNNARDINAPVLPNDSTASEILSFTELIA